MKINSQPSPHSSLLPMGNPKKIDYSDNFTIFDPVQLFPHDIWQVQIWSQHRQGWALSKKIHNPFSICPSHPWVALKNLTIHTITQSLTLSNFFNKSPGEFKFGHNIGRVELYQKNSQPLFYLSLPPLGSPQKFDYSHNYIIFEVVQLFPQVTWRVQIWIRQVSCRKFWTWSKILKLCKKSNFLVLPRGRRDEWEGVENIFS